MRVRRFAWVAALVTLALPTLSRADTIIYSNLGPGSSYDCCSGWSEGGGFGLAQAMAFTVPAGPGFLLTKIEIALTHDPAFDSPPFPFFPPPVRLMGDAAGEPGALIASWPLGSIPDFGSTSTIQPSQVISGISGVTLSGGTQYWLAPLTGHFANIRWNFNSTGAIGPSASGAPPILDWVVVPDLPLGAFAVYGDPVSRVPEPSTLLLLATGIAGLMARRRRVAQS